MIIKNTGERYTPGYDSIENGIEHWHRYLYANEIVENMSVLDIACGTGYGSHLLSLKANNVVGIDINKQAINLARNKYKNNNLSFKVGSVTSIPIEGRNLFDIIVSYETIEHVSEEDQVLFMKEIKRLLKPDGLLLVSTPNKEVYTDETGYKNQFHIKEFYKNEYFDFLSKFFKDVKFVEQKTFLASYIWSEKYEQNHFKNYQLIYKDGQLEIDNNTKIGRYVIAICSDIEKNLDMQSLCLIPERIIKPDEILDMKNSLSWKITKPLRLIKAILTGKNLS